MAVEFFTLANQTFCMHVVSQRVNVIRIAKDMIMRKEQMARADRKPSVEEDELMADSLDDSIVLRPDGYYWQAPDGRQDIGPFTSRELALADMGSADEQAPEPGETLQEAEAELGIADWVDPETGEPAQGQAHPRLE
jgi:hypothetical protein